MRQITLEIRHMENTKRVNVQIIQGEYPDNWTNDVTNAYKLWVLVNLPFALVRQLMRFIRINPAHINDEKENFILTHYSDDTWEAEVSRYQYMNQNYMKMIDQVASFSKENNYRMTL